LFTVSDTASFWQRRVLKALRFRLSSAAIIVLLLCVPLAYLANKIHHQRAKRDAFDRLFRIGVGLQDDYGHSIDAEYLPPRQTYWESLKSAFYGESEELPIVRGVICVRADRRALDNLTRTCHDFPEVQSLLLTGSTVTDADLRRLLRRWKLHTLSLAGTEVTDAALSSISRSAELQLLSLDATAVTDVGMEKLLHLGLSSLSVVDTNVTGAGHAKLRAAFPDAEINWRFRPTGKHQSAMRALIQSGADLVAPDSQLQESHLLLGSPLERLTPALRSCLADLEGYLRVSAQFGATIDDADIPGLLTICAEPKAKALKITVGGQAREPAGQKLFDALGQAGHLEELELEGVWHDSTTTATPLNFLRNLRRLRWVHSESVSWNQLRPLLPQLDSLEGEWDLLLEAGNLHCESLVIAGSGPVDADIIDCLRLNERLRVLDLSHCELTPHALYHLADLTWLQTLRITLPPESEQNLARLKKSLKECKIEVGSTSG
jgi:hypothetical protein